MAGRIQGITVEIGGDTTKLQTALKGINTEIRNTQRQLRVGVTFRVSKKWLKEF